MDEKNASAEVLKMIKEVSLRVDTQHIHYDMEGKMGDH